MNARDILHYGNRTLLQSIEGLAQDDWYAPGVAGVWTVRDIFAHLASFEHVLVDVLHSLVDDSPTPNLDRFLAGPDQFNERELERRQEQSATEVLADYKNAHARTLELLDRIPVESRRQRGMLPWYGPEYDLEDLIVYTIYGHKREHSAHISLFRDQLTGATQRAQLDDDR